MWNKQKRRMLMLCTLLTASCTKHDITAQHHNTSQHILFFCELLLRKFTTVFRGPIAPREGRSTPPNGAVQ